MSYSRPISPWETVAHSAKQSAHSTSSSPSRIAASRRSPTPSRPYAARTSGSWPEEPARASPGPRARLLAGTPPQVDAGVGRVTIDLGKLVLGEREALERSEGVVELLDARDADQRRGDPRVAQRPGERHLRERLPAAPCDLVERADLVERLVRQQVG